MKKPCSVCGVVQPLVNYTVIDSRRHHSHCKGCRRDAARQERQANPERNRERKRRYNERLRQEKLKEE